MRSVCWHLLAVLLVAGVAVLALGEPPTVQAVKQERNHCGVASAETILRAYGDPGVWTGQRALGAALCARMPDYKLRRPPAKGVHEAYYPAFKETYQSELAELLMDRGYCVISTRKSIDRRSKRIRPQVWDLLRTHLLQGHLAIIHVSGHYMVATGIDLPAQTLYFVDPRRPGTVFSADLETFASGASFHTKPDGTLRPGWSGRTLIVWKGKPVNRPDQCPVCQTVTRGRSHRYCKQCRCFIDRRPHNRVQRTIDAIVGTREGLGVTRLQRPRLRTALRALEAEGFSKADIRQGLLHYPLVGPDRKRLATLYRYAEETDVDLTRLTIDDLAEIVAAGERWRTMLESRRARRQP